MLTRCRNPKCRKFHRYGGRGITVCERWLSFDTFLADMGRRPPGMTLDRVDNNGNYEPGNCRWATMAEQQQNRCSNKLDWAKVDSILAAHAAKEGGYRRLSRRFGVSPTMVEHIVRGMKWKRPGGGLRA